MKIFSDVSSLAAATLTADQIVKVKSVGDYRIQDSGTGITLVNGKIAVPQASGTAISVKQFGAVGDGVTDDTAAIQAAIDYCAPYTWKGSVSASKVFDPVKHELFIPQGVYRTTAPILLSPFLRIKGVQSGGFFGLNSSTILADFDGDSILDAAPIDNTGARPTGVAYGRTDWDSGNNVGCPGWVLEDINLKTNTGRSITFGINRTISVQSHINRVGINKPEVGIRTSCTWGGSVRDSHIVANTYGLENFNDTTVELQENNYITCSDIVSTYANLAWPDNNAIKTASACIFQKFANVTYTNNTLEGAKIGIKASYSVPLKDNNTYFEKISDYAYAVHSIHIDLNPAWMIITGAPLYANSSTGKIDFTNTAYLSYTGSSLGSFPFAKAIEVYGHTPVSYNSNLSFPRLHREECNIYVGSTGDDNNSGYRSDAPVLTLQEAITRCIDGASNNIILQSNIDTIYNFDGTNSTNYVSSVNSTILVQGNNFTINVGVSSNQTHAIQFSELQSLTFEDTVISLPASSNADYRAFIRPQCTLSLKMRGVTVTGAGATSALVGSRYSEGGNANMLFTNSTFTNLKLVEDASAFSDSYLMWTENNEGCTFTTVTTDEGMKIKSRQFP